MTIKVTGIRVATGAREELNEFAEQAWRDGITVEAFTDIREEPAAKGLPSLSQAIAAEHVRQEAEQGEPVSRVSVVTGLIWGGLLREAGRRVREKEEQLAALQPADASLEARAEALGRAIIDKLGPLAPTPPRYFRDTCIDLVRAVDASRPPTIFAPWTREEARIRLLGLGHSASEVEAWLDQPAAMLERLTPDCVEAAVLRGVLRGNASRPGLSEEQLRAIVKATIEAKCAQGMADMRVCIAEHELTCAIVAALLRASRGETGIVREPHVDVHCARCDKPVGETAVREGEDVLCLPCSIDDLDGRDLDRSS